MAQLAIGAAINIGVGLLMGMLTRKPAKTEVVEGPRMTDLTVTSSAYGEYRPINYGTVRISGQLIWSTGIQERQSWSYQSAGGKGGGGGGGVVTNTYAYFASYAIAFGEGEGSDIIRIWADGKLIFDKRGGNSSYGSYQHRFYPGNETQLPDPLIEANIGVGRTPAYRGTCYMVCQDWPLKDFGNRIPNITAEVAYVSSALSPKDFFENQSGGAYEVPSLAFPENYMVIDPLSDALYFFTSGAGRASTASLSIERYSALGGFTAKGKRLMPDGFLWAQTTGSNFTGLKKFDPVTFELVEEIGEDSIFGSGGIPFRNPSMIGGIVVGEGTPGVDAQVAIVASRDSSEGFGHGGFDVTYKGADGEWTREDFAAVSDIGDPGPVIQDFTGHICYSVQQSSGFVELWKITVSVGISLVGGLANPSTGEIDLFPPGPVVQTVNASKIGSWGRGTAINVSGDIQGFCQIPSENALILSDGAGMFKVDLETGQVLEENVSLGFTSYDQWTTNGMFAFVSGTTIYTISTDNLEVIRSQPIAPFGVTANSTNCYDSRNHSLYISRGNSAGEDERIARLLLDRGGGQGVSLGSIVQDICERAGLESDQFDVSNLASETVEGYVLTRQGSAREGLQPLMQAFLFEGAEVDWSMKFVPRGGGSVVSIPADYVGQFSTDPASPPVREIIALETELPERVTVTYFDKDNDYQSGSQAGKRITNPTPSQFAQNEQSLNLSIVGQATPIKQLAERWLYTIWSERTTLESVLPWRYIRLDPTDVFTITGYQGEDRLLRLGQAEVGTDLSIKFTATQTDARSNDSAAVGSPGDGVPVQTIPSNLPTKLFLLDLPVLQATDDGGQVFCRAYWAGAGYDDTWRGTTLAQSTDQASSFFVIDVTSEAVGWGRVDGTLADPSTTGTWDNVGFDVNIVAGLDKFATASESDVLSGANLLAVRRTDGTWELLQFQTVTQVDDNTLTLSRLLRGRLGTETLAYGHAANAECVLLRDGEVGAFRLPLAQLDQRLVYRAPTVGQALEDASNRSFAYTGEDLRPYSPVLIEGSRDGSGNLTLEWVRRTRFNGELRDGHGEVPLNEEDELYDVEVMLGERVYITQEDLESPEASVTAAAWTAAGGVAGDLGLLNGGLETEGLDSAWTQTGDGFFTGTYIVEGAGAHSGNRYFHFGQVVDSYSVKQTVDLLEMGWTQDEIDNEQPTINFDWWQFRGATANADSLTATMRFLDDSDVVISSSTTGAVVPTAGVWEQPAGLSAALPPGASKVQIEFNAHRFASGLDSADIGVDDVTLTTGVGVPKVRIKVYQKSAIVGRGRAGEVHV